MRVFVVRHTYPSGVAADEDNALNVKLIGVFSSEALAQTAVARLKDQPGFRDHPEGFSSGPVLVDQIYWDGGFEEKFF